MRALMSPAEMGAASVFVVFLTLKLIGAFTGSWWWVFLAPPACLAATYVLALASIGLMILVNLASVILFPDED